MKVKIPLKLTFKKFTALVFILAVGIFIGLKFPNQLFNPSKPKAEINTPKAFVSEVYDKILQNYWNNISEAELLELFKASMNRSGGNITQSKFENKEKMLDGLSAQLSGLNDEQKNKFITSTVSSVLISLNPVGRSGLYTQKNEEALKNTVQNINPEKDLYKDLGLSKGASEEEVSKAYQKQAEELNKDSSPEAQDKLKKLTYAKDVLSSKDQKTRYDSAGIEPTIFSKVLATNILYVQFKKFSPTSLEEFQKTFDSYKDNMSLDSLIFDLRGNIGGAIDATSYFLGFFLGQNQYAFDFYHKGEYVPFKTQTTKLPSLSKYKQITVLVDNQTQSSAEMLASSLKKYHMAVVVGVPTKGWGTVERVFPLENQFTSKEKYSIFLVHSLTLRDDNQPIEGRGVDPDINITNKNWQNELYSYFRNQKIIDATADIL